MCIRLYLKQNSFLFTDPIRLSSVIWSYITWQVGRRKPSIQFTSVLTCLICQLSIAGGKSNRRGAEREEITLGTKTEKASRKCASTFFCGMCGKMKFQTLSSHSSIDCSKPSFLSCSSSAHRIIPPSPPHNCPLPPPHFWITPFPSRNMTLQWNLLQRHKHADGWVNERRNDGWMNENGGHQVVNTPNPVYDF